MSVPVTQDPARAEQSRLLDFGRRWGWAAILLVGLLLFWLIHWALLATRNPNLVPALIFFGAAVIPAGFVSFVSSRRLGYGVGMGTVAATALAGGAIGVTCAGVLEYRTLLLLGILPTMAVGLIEEAAKLIVPLFVMLIIRVRRPSDGLLIGVASGAGFAVFETMGYAFVELIDSNGDLTAVDHLLVLRGLLSPAAHMAWTGLTATALWSAAAQHYRKREVNRLALTYVVAVALHTAWDSFNSDTAYAVLAALSLFFLVLTTHRLASPAVAVRTAAILD
ncbi:PrsW family intramembrane metalloprotease [Actinacidiphila guanduensis]|uniref:Membrane proteinase PrsW, cleaves anti-sigma factor RsiW, M82 family n=1 Tax=Actinacidiphila guanduensis TaxID=310781 RepID=A0A1H0SD88_9ACTN|nr:PrsW family intramembrane metalloprotease [Actinacidiphila guanduensis]SDP39188.1 Membrane proteinase PrsW, cleaves anti-sigma factor RsiW, M82 family [Actinacidiphila guanduensis]